MITLSDAHKAILERYNRPIVHLRQQIEEKRFGLLFGAGMSKSFGVPTWEELVTLLSKDSEVNGQEVVQTVSPRASLPYKTEMLFEHYKKLRYNQSNQKEHNTRKLDYQIGSDWREIIRKYLYSDAADKIEDHLAKHEYLSTYLPLIGASRMTVTFNYDNFIEMAVSYLDRENKSEARGFETVTNPWPQFRRTTGIIYHPNGVIPRNPLETPSDRFVFSEASYVEQLMGLYSGNPDWLVNHFSKTTCLFIGLSLNDDILRSVLAQSARSCPGNFHYYVQHIKDNEELTEQQKHAIRLANFKVYNLITLFLHSGEIRIFGELLDKNLYPTEPLCDLAESNDIKMHFPFYVTGALGVGKSTTINQFRNLIVYDEWVGERHPLLAKDWEELTDAEKEEADEWVINQFHIKDEKLRRAREGIFLIDRGPLDPCTFTPSEEWQAKARYILDELCPNRKWQVQKGKVILFKGDHDELALRMISTRRTHYTSDKLEKMELRIAEVYGTDGVINLDTSGLTPSEVTRRVAEIIHLEEHDPICNLHDRLESIENGETSA